jgi:signal transduction histidine kinase
MINIVNLSLENEMDLVLAHKRSMKVAEKLGLTMATQTTFATAVSEIARTVIEQTNTGILEIGLEEDKQRHNLLAKVTFDSDIHFTDSDTGFYYAQKLVPEFQLVENGDHNVIDMKIGVPRSIKLDPIKLRVLKKFFEDEPPLNAYEEIKQRNQTLHRIADMQEEELRQSRIIDEKKTEFISIASHEIKTPITIIKAYTQLAKRLKGQCSAQINEILDKVDAQTSKLLSLVQQLLDVAKVENGTLQYNMEEVELNAFISSMVNILKFALPDHEIVASYSENIMVNIDKLRIEQVFSNLLGNASKYSQKNTQINIAFDIQDDAFVRIAIIDQGIGMSPGSIDSIFNKFYRDKDVLKTHAGLGMGLYISSKIISDHGGKIWVESIEEQGSTFLFTIPIAKTSGQSA